MKPPGIRAQVNRGAPPTGSTDDEEEGPPPIGVPAGYKATVPGKKPRWGIAKNASQYAASLPREVTPRYNVGDESRPAYWGTERIINLQAQLVDAGLLDRRKYRRGVWDPASREAYQELLGVANAAGLDDMSALRHYREMAARYGAPADDPEVRQPFIGTRIDPERLGSLLDQVSLRTIGRKIGPEERARFSNAFNETLLAAQRKEYEMSGSGGPGGPGGVVDDPDPQGQAEKHIRETRPQEALEYSYIQRFKDFQQLLGA